MSARGAGDGPGLGSVVGLGLVVCFVLGQVELWSRRHAAHVPHELGLIAPVVFGVTVAGVITACVCLWWYLRHGRWVPGRYRAGRAPRAPRFVVGRDWAGPVEPHEIRPGLWVVPDPDGENNGAPAWYSEGETAETDSLFYDPEQGKADDSAR